MKSMFFFTYSPTSENYNLIFTKPCLTADSLRFGIFERIAMLNMLYEIHITSKINYFVICNHRHSNYFVCAAISPK